jgi:beta-mannosidase
MAQLKIEIVDDAVPGAAEVSAHSRFRAVSGAARCAASVIETPARPSGHSQVRAVVLDGEWRRRAMANDPSAPPVGPDFDDSEWDRVFVPNNYGLEPALSAHFGPVYYRRRLAPLDAPHALLVFDAVDYLADVWIDGEHLGRHEGYFAPFMFDLTGKIRPGSVLTVRVQDPFEEWSSAAPFLGHAKRVIKGTLKYHDSRPGGLPGSMTPGWNARLAQSLTTGGITRSVRIRGTGAARIDAVFVTPLECREGVIQLAIVITNLSPAALEASIDLAIAAPSARDTLAGTIAVALQPGANRVDARIAIPNPKLWWPASHADLGAPELYRLDARVYIGSSLSDEQSARFGIRTARVQGEPKRMMLNGRAIFIQAANYIPRQHFADVDVNFYRRDMALAAAAHLNSLGVHGHVQTPACYDAADEAGILIFQDFALQWHYDSGAATNPGFIDTARRQIAEMAYTYWNHPSIVYWACHNEPNAMFLPGQARDTELDGDNQVLDEALEERLRAVDPSRHIHRASGIGDDLHLYDGSLSGGSVYGVRKHQSWFVSEFGFWTLGPQASRWNDQGWPPDDLQMKEWLSRLSFGPSTMSFAGLPERYPSLRAWQRATEAYGSFLAKYQTEWFRINRGRPFNAYRWHFFADWWGWAGGGLVDVDRRPKATYHALAAASRPVLVCASLPNTVVTPGQRLEFPIHAVNELRVPVKLAIEWRWMIARRSIVIGVDREVGRRYMVPRATNDAMAAMPYDMEEITSEPAHGAIEATVAPESSALLATIALAAPDEALAGATLVMCWNGERNWFHVLAAPEGWFCGPGAFVVSPVATCRLGEESDE